jgi:hypothetical protein
MKSMPRQPSLFSPLTHPGYLPELLHRLKRLLPQVQALHKLLINRKAPSLLAAKAPLVAYLLEVLPLLPDLGDYDLYPPPPPALPRLVVHATGKVYLDQSLIIHLNLRGGQPIGLHPPGYNSQYWHLDLRPEAPNVIDWYPGKRAKIKRVDLPALMIPQQGQTLLLVPGEPAYPKIYPMIPFDAEPT